MLKEINNKLGLLIVFLDLGNNRKQEEKFDHKIYTTNIP